MMDVRDEAGTLGWQTNELVHKNTLGLSLKAKFKAAWEASKDEGLIRTVDLALMAAYSPETIPDEIAARCSYGDNRENLRKPIGGLPVDTTGVSNQLKKMREQVWMGLRNGDYSKILREGVGDFFRILAERYPDTVVSVWTESEIGRRLEQLAKINSLPVGHKTLSTSAQNDSFGGINIAALEKRPEGDKVSWIIDKMNQDGGKRDVLIIDDKPHVIEKVITELEKEGFDLSKVKFIHLLQGRANMKETVVTERYPGQIHRLNDLSELVNLLEKRELGEPGLVAVDMDDTLTDDDKRIELQAKIFADVLMKQS